MDAKQIGTVEILMDRVYYLDPTVNGMQVFVPPGVYPLYEYGDTRFWLVEGQLNARNLNLGDGLIVMKPYDDPVAGFTVRVPSKLFGPDDWEAFLKLPMCQEGHPAYRLRIRVWEATWGR